MARIFKFFAFLFIFIFLFTIGLLFSGYRWFKDYSLPPGGNKNIKVSIPQGYTTRKIALLLKENGLIKSTFVFRLYIKILAVDYKLKPGNYTFNTNESLNSIAYKLVKGNEQTVNVTIPEGLTLEQIADILQAKQICNKKDFLDAVNSPELIGKIFNDWEIIPAGEGLAFPDTYKFSKNSSAKVVAGKMLKLTKYKIDEIFTDDLPQNLTPYEGCILASIIEKEAKIALDRPVIASVFYNRLKRKMKLESCATVQYILPKHKNRLLYEDLKADSPYNTYKNIGLPPTPISNFGVSSLEAVASPAHTSYLYFVSDGENGHKFAKTLKQHNRNRYKFYKKRRKNKK